MTDKPKDADVAKGATSAPVADVPKVMSVETPSTGLGKTWKGQKFPPVRSVESVRSDAVAQQPFNKPGAVAIEVYFATKGIRNPVQQAGMRAFTKIKRATIIDWDAIFKTF